MTRPDHASTARGEEPAANPLGAGSAAASREPTRPAVSVVVPFRGGRSEAEALLAALGALSLGADDELIVADNTPDGVVAGAGQAVPTRAQVVPAAGERSSYHARNVGADRARGEWLLFLDADCRPPSTLLDHFLSEPAEHGWGAIAGAVVGASDQRALVARYSRARGHLSQEDFLRHPFRPFAVTANLLVRRSAWAGVGGFGEGMRSGGDADLCWRLHAAGWTIAYRPEAVVEHLHRESPWTLARQMARYGAGRAWLNRRYPGTGPRRPVGRPLARCGAGVAGFALFGERERALFKALDAIALAAGGAGYFLGNAPPRTQAGPQAGGVVVLPEVFPRLSETFVAAEAHALEGLGVPTRIEAVARAERPGREWARGLRINYLEDEGIARKLATLGWLALRHPQGCVRDLLDRRRWAREEPVRPLRWLAPAALRASRGGARHLHAHFAHGAALDAMRLGRLLGLPYSVTAHAYEIFSHPRNLREKLERADFVNTGCDYNVKHLRTLVGPGHAERVHEIVMGVDPERFRRRRPAPGTGNVLAVGRLVEKKGFDHLIEAMALLRARGAIPERVTIVGDGPLGSSLARQARRLGVDDVVALVGAREPREVLELLERADLLAMPCVIAADGDRDSMPVVVKEALAMEVPVVASDEVGLPEIVGEGWGRLVPPGDAAALAAAIEEILALEPGQRAAMGRAGRAFVIEHGNLQRETAKLAGLMGLSGARAGRSCRRRRGG